MIRDREAPFLTEIGIHEANLLKMLENRDNVMKASFESRDKDWLNSLEHCKESFRLTTCEQVNNRTLMESLAKRQRELTKNNVKILDWAMKIVSRKKKVSLPQISIWWSALWKFIWMISPYMGATFEEFLANLETVLHRCIEKNLVLNWEKCHLMVNQGIFLGHFISKKGIEVDKAKFELISKPPPPTNVKAVR